VKFSWYSADTVIERLRNPGSTIDAVASRCIHEKDISLQLGAKQFIRCGGPTWLKAVNRTVLCWSTHSLLVHPREEDAPSNGARLLGYFEFLFATIKCMTRHLTNEVAHSIHKTIEHKTKIPLSNIKTAYCRNSNLPQLLTQHRIKMKHCSKKFIAVRKIICWFFWNYYL